MNKLLLTSALVLGLAAPALAQATSPNNAVGNASILPGGGSGASNVLPADPGQTSILPDRNGGSSGSVTGIDNGTTQSVTPNVTVPNATTSNSVLPNSTTPNLNQPGTSLNGGVVPNSSGSIQGTLNNSGVPGSTSTGPAGGGSSAY